MRILHFSDIHLGRPSFAGSSLFDKRLLGTFNYVFRRRGSVDENAIERLLEKIPALKPDLIVCSGDITCVGSPAEFSAAIEALKPFVATPDSTFLYTPGNHDAYVRKADCVQALKHAVKILNPPACDLNSDPFQEISVAGVDIALLSLAHPTNIFLSCGTLTHSTVASLDKWCKERQQSDQPSVLVGHFPTRRQDGKPLGFRRRLKGGEHIIKHLKNGDINLYLCGHIHSPFLREFPGGSLECCTGSLTMKQIFSIIDIKSGGNITHTYEKL